MAALATVVNGVNVLTVLHDAAREGDVLAWWEPLVWEGSSLALILALAVGIHRALRAAPPEAVRWGRFIGVHLAGSLIFSSLHVGGMVALRKLIYAAAGETYVFSLTVDEFLYEYRKDAVAYVLFAAVFWAVGRLARKEPSATAAAADAVFVIRDGSRTLRTRVADIVCASSAGNYVEFTLSDGRRPLRRATLAGVEAELAGHGFVRSHRSWLINPEHVREVVPTGSGDFLLRLSGGGTAPLSRRSSKALAALTGRPKAE